ncbi:hypothetical protein D3C87_1608730 [compost metagenome]
MAGGHLGLGAFRQGVLLRRQLLGLPTALCQLRAQRLQLLLRGVKLRLGGRLGRVDLRLLALQLL